MFTNTTATIYKKAIALCVVLLATLSFASSASANQVYSYHVQFNDGIPFQDAIICVGEGCASRIANGSRNEIGGFSDSNGNVAVEASQGQTVEFLYEKGYRNVNQNQGMTWDRVSAGDGRSQITLAHLLTPGVHPAMSKNEARFVELVNEVRAQNGLSAVAPIQSLANIADIQASWQFRNSVSVFNHSGEYGWSPQARAYDTGYSVSNNIGEIAGFSPNIHYVFQAFLNSPSHRAIILQPAARYIGPANVGNQWTVVFATDCTARCEPAVFDPNTPDVPPVPLDNSGNGPSPLPYNGPGTRNKPSVQNDPNQRCQPALSSVSAKKQKGSKVKITAKVYCAKGAVKLAVKIGKKTKYYSLKKNTATVKAGSKKLQVGIRLANKTYALKTVKVK